jgi:hypothetical protein
MRVAGLSVCLAITAALAAGCGRSATTPTAPGATGSPPPAIGTLVDNTTALAGASSGGVGTDNWAGQSLTVPGTGRYNNLAFNWYAYWEPVKGSPVAFGTLYLLNEEFLGLPGDLSTSTAGFVARSRPAAGGQYLFEPGVTIAAGVRYWFYADTRGRFSTGFFEDTFPGGDLYVTGWAALGFHRALASWWLQPDGTYLKPAPGTGIDADFKLQGAPAGD